MNNEALNVLINRRAIRKFKPEQIKDEELDAVLKAGEYAPTAMGLQSPLIIAVQNKEDVARLNELSLKILEEKHGGNPRPGTLPESPRTFSALPLARARAACRRAQR